MTLENLQSLSNKDLLEVFDLMVRADHYDPFETPKKVQELYSAGITYETLHDMVLSRMQ